ncbi:MAG: Yip1 family protein [Petrimonas sp.]|uniref:Yip1 family protein n=1 Tax=Petrimonas sp. TaxID=2023866 RepID=UPI000964FBB9|nr:Yip1 family protein [Petrimonas sp.]MEA5044568.1 Yip1 family protein [Petrimonas sp.]OJV37592.1 MAG: hypothetical protein BGO33_01725 [Bacteroidia bacterium 43-41]
MNIIQRAKNIIISPKTEWEIVANEDANITGIMVNYVLVLACLSAVAAFIGQGLIGTSVMGIRIGGINWGIYYALNILVSAVLSTLVTAFVIDALAPQFGVEKNLPRSFQLVAYSFTPVWIGGLLAIIPTLGILGGLLGLYGLYLLYIGLPPIKKVSAEKQTGYFALSLVVTIVVYAVIGFVLSRILLATMGLSHGISVL